MAPRREQVDPDSLLIRRVNRRRPRRNAAATSACRATANRADEEGIPYERDAFRLVSASARGNTTLGKAPRYRIGGA
jgi:hypothetical protein